MRSPAFDDALRGFRASIPFWLGFIPLGFILGAQASRQGMSAVTAGFMAFFNYAGGSEFAAVALWSAAPPVLLIALTTWLINSRHIVLGAALSIYTRRQSFLENAFLFFLMCDEVWAVSMNEIRRRRAEGASDDEAFSYAFHVGAGFGFWIPWALTTASGAYFGNALGDLDRFGFAMAFPATFITLIVLMWPGWRRSAPIAASAAAAAAASLWLPSWATVLAGTAAGLAAAVWGPHAEEEGA